MFSRGIVAAMESEAQNAELAIDEAGSESMEADLVETVDMAANIDSGTSEVEQTIKDAGQLERHVEVLTDAEGEGGAAPEVIEATEIAVEGICSRLGIYGGTGIPALESFSTKTGRQRNTRVAIESIGEKIKQIWEAVKMAFKKLVNYVKDFFAKLFDANAKMLARVNTLRVKAKNVKGVAAEKISGASITAVIGETKLKNAKAGTGAGGIQTSMKKAVGDSGNLKKVLDGLDSQATFDAFNVGGASDAIDGMSAPDGFIWSKVMEVGTSSIGYLSPKTTLKGKEAYEALSKASVKVKKDENKKDGEIASLTRDEALTTLNEVETAVRELIGSKTIVASINATLEQTIATINSKVSAAGKDDDTMGSRSTSVRSAVTSGSNAVVKLISSIGSETTRVCQAYLTYVERSLSGFKAEEAKKDEKK